MTLRDYFASQALGVAYQQCEKAGDTGGWATVAQIAYCVADFMIAERNRTTNAASEGEA